MRIGQRVDQDRAVGVGRIGEGGLARERLEDRQRLQLQRIELARVGARRAGHRFSRAGTGCCAARRRSSSPGRGRTGTGRRRRAATACPRSRAAGRGDRRTENRCARSSRGTGRRRPARTAAAADEHDVAGGVAGAVQHAEDVLADRDLVALFEPAVGHHVARVGQAEAPALRREPLEQEEIARVRPLDRDPGPRRARRPRAAAARGLLELRRTPAWSMWPWVNRIFSTRTPWRSIASRMRGTSPPGSTTAARRARLVPQEHAVLLERRHRDHGNLQSHGAGPQSLGPAFNLRTDCGAVKPLEAPAVRRSSATASCSGVGGIASLPVGAGADGRRRCRRSLAADPGHSHRLGRFLDSTTRSTSACVCRRALCATNGSTGAIKRERWRR